MPRKELGSSYNRDDINYNFQELYGWVKSLGEAILKISQRYGIPLTDEERAALNGLVGGNFVPITRKVNEKPLSSDITLQLDSSDFANQGTETTVLHGNASGNPSFGPVVMDDIDDDAKSGMGDKLITGTAGVDGNPAVWDEHGGLVDGLEHYETSGENYIEGYYKYADGRLECYKVVTLTNISVNTTWGNVYNYAYTVAGDFLHPFTFVEYVGGACLSASHSLWVANRNTVGQPSNTSWGDFLIVRPSSATGVTCTLYLRAIGRWK